MFVEGEHVTCWLRAVFHDIQVDGFQSERMEMVKLCGLDRAIKDRS